MPLVFARINNVKLLVIGDGPLLEYHSSLVGRFGIGNKVEFMGNVPNHLLPAILNAADVYVSTSFSDGSSASLMEAMACGLPVVVTRIPANEEWVVHGKNGFLVKPGDSVTLAQYLITVLRDEELRSLMGKANLQVAKKRADWRVNSLVLEKAVYDLLARRAPDEGASQTLERGAGKNQHVF
jgi:glycosyltransferase involved in cell wall biosynthesis